VSSARGGDAGCAFNGIAPDKACRADEPQVAEQPRPVPAGPPVRVDAHSADSADVSCVADRESRTCRSGDTRPVQAVSSAEGGTRPSPWAAVAAVASSGTSDVIQPVGSANGSEKQPSSAAGISLIVLLVNAAVPLLALLSLAAMVMTSRRRRALRAPRRNAKHRRKQQLPVSTVPARHR